MDDFTLAAAAAAAFTGLSGSLHCAAMCGPLACAPLPAASSARRRAIAAWQAGRVVGYASAGAVLGASGAVMLSRVPALQQVAPWLVVGGLLVSGLDLFRRLGALPGVSRVHRALMKASANFSPAVRAGAMGALTPLLPCGLLYGVFISAASTGNAAAGAGLMGAFALGALPALLAVQGLGSRLSFESRWARAARTAVLLLAAGVLAWRALNVEAGAPPNCH